MKQSTGAVLDSPTQPVPSVPSPSVRALTSPDVCAKFITTTHDGRTEALLLSVGKPILIGRNPNICIKSSTGAIHVSCQDMSTNGLIINGYKIRKTSAIVMHGDTVRIPASLTFQCIQKWRCLPDKPTTYIAPSPPSIKNMGRYLITPHCLGTGSYATVHLAIDTSAHRQVACKIIKRKQGSDLKKDMKEATMLMALHHPNINRVYAVDSDSGSLHIMLQLCTGGDLFTYITTHARRRLCEGESKYITYQLLKGLKYLHDRMISHRVIFHIQPENILLHTPGPYPRVQIADFGLARPRAFQETLHVCGTISYLPPEGVRALDCPNLGYVGMPADCWSTGVVLFAMLSWVYTFSHVHSFCSSSC
ncbi:kinase-like protein [Pisolithus microcarpus]|nr:kinase-like protein [Pisolithus microcarpus]